MLATASVLLAPALFLIPLISLHSVNLVLFLRTIAMVGLSPTLVWRHPALGLGVLAFALVGLLALPAAALALHATPYGAAVLLILLAHVCWAGTLGAWLVGRGLDVGGQPVPS
jgi:hypothetical protein